MEKTNGYYVAKYLKNNALVLACELVVVLLLSLICTIIIEAEPMWLAPVIGVATYLVAELRFMMAYVATNARHEHDMAVAKGEIAQEEQTLAPVAAASCVAAAAAVEQDEEPEAQIDDAEDVENVEDEQEPEECCAPDVEDGEPEERSDEHEQTEQQVVETDEMAEPVFDEAPVQTSLEMNDEDEVMDALFGAPLLGKTKEEQADIVLDPIHTEDDDLNGMTMDGDDFACDVLEIGEVAPTADNKEQ